MLSACRVPATTGLLAQIFGLLIIDVMMGFKETVVAGLVVAAVSAIIKLLSTVECGIQTNTKAYKAKD